MSRRLHNIFRLLLVMLPGLLAVATTTARAANVVRAGETIELGVVEVAGDTYVWELYNNPVANFATIPGNINPSEAYFVGGINTGPTVSVHWLVPGTYFFKVTAYGPDGCSNNLKVGIMIVEHALPTAQFLDPDPVCIGDEGSITLELSGTAPFTVSYTYTLQGSGEVHTATITGINTTTYDLFVTHHVAGTYEYQVISVTDGNNLTNDDVTRPVQLRVDPRPVTSPIYRYDPLTRGDE